MYLKQLYDNKKIFTGKALHITEQQMSRVIKIIKDRKTGTLSLPHALIEQDGRGLANALGGLETSTKPNE